jgi:hypothetical protein
MRRRDSTALTAAVLGALALTAEAAAGQIRGNLRGPAKTAEAPVEIEITCPREPARADKTAAPGQPVEADEAETPGERAQPAPPTSYKQSRTVPGYYALDVREQGDCELTVTYQGMTASLLIVSQRRSVKYDLVLSVAKGKLNVRRR